MNSISNQFDITRENVLLDQAKNKLEKGVRFDDYLKKVQDKSENISPQQNKPVDEKLMNLCYEFESILINQMFKVMKGTIHKEDSLLYGGHAEKIFDDMLYDQYSLKTAKTGEFGLAKQIYEQLNQTRKV